MIRELAHLALLDGASHAELYALAKAGQFGENHGNAHRDIMAEFAKGLAIESNEVTVPCIDPKTSEKEDTKAAIFLPHLVLSNLATHYQSNSTLCFQLVT